MNTLPENDEAEYESKGGNFRGNSTSEEYGDDTSFDAEEEPNGQNSTEFRFVYALYMYLCAIIEMA